eukprot:c22911_g1_i1 orf=182-1024(+)
MGLKLVRCEEKEHELSDEKGQCVVSWIDATSSNVMSINVLCNQDIVKSPPKDSSDCGCRTNKVGLGTDLSKKPKASAAGFLRQPLFPAGASSPSTKQVQVVLSSNSQSNAARKNVSGIKSAPLHSNSYLKSYQYQMNFCNENVSSKSWQADHLKKGTGLLETAKLAKQLRDEAESWFLKFMEEALDSEFKSAIRDAKSLNIAENQLHCTENTSQIMAVLLNLKRMNDWLDQVTSNKKKILNTMVTETTDRLKHKLYGFLIQFCLCTSGPLSDELCTWGHR